MQLFQVPRTRSVYSTPSVHRRAQAPEAPSLIDIAPPEIYDPLTALTTGDESEHCGMQGSVMQREPPPDATGKKFFIHTMGCQMNLADSERMAGALEASGYSCTEEASEAEVLIYNTCSIRQKAENKVYSALGRQVKRKRAKFNDVKIVVAGCVAQQEGQALLRRVPEVDVVMGPQHANQIHNLLAEAETGQVLATDWIDIIEDVAQPRRESDITAWVNVIYGCNEKCSYCVVPYTRGAEKSRHPDDIVREVAGLAEQGYKEVTLLGQNVDAYGRDLPGMDPDASGRRLHTFAGLLRSVSEVEGIERIRFATSHPRYFTERLIRTCAELPKLCEFFHIPFQAGDDDILREMLRGYTHKRYREIVHNIRRNFPDASISGDAIVGFPGETEEQFQRTMDLVREVGFDRVNTAAYSPRPNTPAADLDNQVADLIKADRLNRLNAVVNEVAEERAQRFKGRTVEVLVEGPNPRDPTQAMGRTRHNKLCFFPGNGAELKATLVNVKIEEIRAYTLSGSIVP